LEVSVKQTNWSNPDDRESAIAAKWAEAAAELDRLKAINAELVAVLENAVFHVHNQGDVGVDEWIAVEKRARAIIAKATS
jgi:hypothetical protein